MDNIFYTYNKTSADMLKTIVKSQVHRLYTVKNIFLSQNVLFFLKCKTFWDYFLVKENIFNCDTIKLKISYKITQASEISTFSKHRWIKQSKQRLVSFSAWISGIYHGLTTFS